MPSYEFINISTLAHKSTKDKKFRKDFDQELTWSCWSYFFGVMLQPSVRQRCIPLQIYGSWWTLALRDTKTVHAKKGITDI